MTGKPEVIHTKQQVSEPDGRLGDEIRRQHSEPPIPGTQVPTGPVRVAPASYPRSGSFREKKKLDLTPETNSDLRLRALKALSLDLDRSMRTLSL
jgi:hypothetical protein